MRKEVKDLFDSKMKYYTRDQFAKNGKTDEISFCWNQMNMEILYAYGEINKYIKRFNFLILTPKATDKKILYYSGSTDNNEKSLVMRLSGNGNTTPRPRTMLFMGDFEGKAPLQALLGHGVNAKLESDVWVLPHHGATLKLADQEYRNLAMQVGAKTIVISSNINHQSFHHPRCSSIGNALSHVNGIEEEIKCNENSGNLEKDASQYVQCWKKKLNYCYNFPKGVKIKQTTFYNGYGTLDGGNIKTKLM
jgi:hypothetical protein